MGHIQEFSSPVLLPPVSSFTCYWVHLVFCMPRAGEGGLDERSDKCGGAEGVPAALSTCFKPSGVQVVKVATYQNCLKLGALLLWVLGVRGSLFLHFQGGISSPRHSQPLFPTYFVFLYQLQVTPMNLTESRAKSDHKPEAHWHLNPEVAFKTHCKQVKSCEMQDVLFHYPVLKGWQLNLSYWTNIPRPMTDASYHQRRQACFCHKASCQ